MQEQYRPDAGQVRLFAALAKEIRARQRDFVSAAQWFATDFSIQAIDARAEADMDPMERAAVQDYESAGWVRNRYHDPSGYMKRLVRACDYLIDIDDTALPRPDREEHYRRAMLVGALMTDPDFADEAPELAAVLGMDRSHWPTARALTVQADGEVVLDRWWARDVVFDPNFSGNRPFQLLLERALDALATRGGEGRIIPAAPDGPTTLNVGVSVHVPAPQPIINVSVPPAVPPVVHVNVPPAQPVIHVAGVPSPERAERSGPEQLGPCDRALALLVKHQRDGVMPSLRRLATQVRTSHTTLSRNEQFMAAYNRLKEQHEREKSGRLRRGTKDPDTGELLTEADPDEPGA